MVEIDADSSARREATEAAVCASIFDMAARVSGLTRARFSTLAIAASGSSRDRHCDQDLCLGKRHIKELELTAGDGYS